jgi:quercetin dioxygenase-like cupin family protein
MLYHPAAETTANPGQEAWFTGRVWVETLASGDAGPASLVRVSFEPGARTAWHTHAKGQILMVTSGRGFAQKRGEPRQPIAAGDVVVITPGEDHWHGAAPDCSMQHVAVHQPGDVVWGEAVADADYTG